MNKNKHLGISLRELRLSLKMEQKDLAAQLGCSQQQISRIENGNSVSKFILEYMYFLKRKGTDMNDLFRFITADDAEK